MCTSFLIDFFHFHQWTVFCQVNHGPPHKGKLSTHIGPTWPHQQALHCWWKTFILSPWLGKEAVTQHNPTLTYQLTKTMRTPWWEQHRPFNPITRMPMMKFKHQTSCMSVHCPNSSAILVLSGCGLDRCSNRLSPLSLTFIALRSICASNSAGLCRRPFRASQKFPLVSPLMSSARS